MIWSVDVSDVDVRGINLWWMDPDDSEAVEDVGHWASY